MKINKKIKFCHSGNFCHSVLEIRQNDRMNRLFSRRKRGKALNFWDSFLTTSPLRGTPPFHFVAGGELLALVGFVLIPSVAERFFTPPSLSDTSPKISFVNFKAGALALRALWSLGL